MSEEEKKNPVGRPGILIGQMREDFFECLALSMTIDDSCAFAGLSKQTYYNWLRKGEEQTEGIYKEFVDELKKAMSAAKMELVRSIKADQTWQAKAWILERRHPEEYARRQILDVTSDNKVTHSFEGLTFDEKKKLLLELKAKENADNGSN